MLVGCGRDSGYELVVSGISVIDWDILSGKEERALKYINAIMACASQATCARKLSIDKRLAFRTHGTRESSLFADLRIPYHAWRPD